MISFYLFCIIIVFDFTTACPAKWVAKVHVTRIVNVNVSCTCEDALPSALKGTPGKLRASTLYGVPTQYSSSQFHMLAQLGSHTTGALIYPCSSHVIDDGIHIDTIHAQS
jgi:hypothetical protein